MQADDHAWEQYLPQSLDDRTVQGSVKTLFDQVQLHVENFYGIRDVKITAEVANNLSKLQTPHLPDSVAAVMSSAKTPLPVIKHCLAYMVAQSIGVGIDSTTTLLPPAYASIASGFHLPDTEDPNAVGTYNLWRESTALANDTIAQRQAFSKWKELTAYFTPEPFANPEDAANRDKAISSMVETFADAFFLWDSQPRDEAQARQHLTELLKNAANVAVMLFAQPSTFEFRWQQEAQDGTRKRSLVVVPAFVKVADERGHLLGRSQGLTQAVVERL